MTRNAQTTLDQTKLYSKAVMESMLAKKQEAQKSLPPQQGKPPAQETCALIKWTVEEKDGKVQLKAVPITTEVDASSVLVEDAIKSPDMVSLFGIRIDIRSKLEAYKENYTKNFVLSRSHNLLVAKFAEMKVAFYGTLLSLLGVPSAEISDMQRSAASSAIRQNKVLFEENEYTSELLSIIGGGKKYMKTQQSVIREIRKQLISQCEKLGLKDYYTKEKVLEIQMDQCAKIASKLLEERMGLEYHASMFDQGIVS